MEKLARFSFSTSSSLIRREGWFYFTFYSDQDCGFLRGLQRFPTPVPASLPPRSPPPTPPPSKRTTHLINWFLLRTKEGMIFLCPKYENQSGRVTQTTKNIHICTDHHGVTRVLIWLISRSAGKWVLSVSSCRRWRKRHHLFFQSAHLRELVFQLCGIDTFSVGEGTFLFLLCFLTFEKLNSWAYKVMSVN